MEEIIELTKIDFSYVFIAVFVILIGIKVIVSLIEWVIEKLGLETKWMRNIREEHELLIKTSQNLNDLQQQHSKDVEESNLSDKNIKEEFSAVMNGIQNSVSQIQKEVKELTDNGKERTKQIEALMCGSKELLGAEIDKRYREYISLDGIPESEVGEFDDIFEAYKSLNGNHGRDVKYQYVKEHLKVIPVETKLVIKNNK